MGRVPGVLLPRPRALGSDTAFPVADGPMAGFAVSLCRDMGRRVVSRPRLASMRSQGCGPDPRALSSSTCHVCCHSRGKAQDNGVGGCWDLKVGEGLLGHQVTRDQPPPGPCHRQPPACPWKCDSCHRNKATMEGTPPHPSSGGPPSMTPTARGHPHALRQCCNHRTCLAPPGGAHAGDLRGASLAWWQPRGSQLRPSRRCCLTWAGVQGFPHTFHKAKLPPGVAPCLTLSDDPPLYLSFPICRGEVGGGPFGPSVPQRRSVCSFCTLSQEVKIGFSLCL